MNAYVLFSFFQPSSCAHHCFHAKREVLTLWSRVVHAMTGSYFARTPVVVFSEERRLVPPLCISRSLYFSVAFSRTSTRDRSV